MAETWIIRAVLVGHVETEYGNHSSVGEREKKYEGEGVFFCEFLRNSHRWFDRELAAMLL